MSPNSPLEDTTCCGCLNFPVLTPVRRTSNTQPSIQRVGSSLLQSAGHVENVEAGGEDVPGVETISTVPSQIASPFISEAPSMNIGNGDSQSRETEGKLNLPMTLFQGASNFQIGNTNITAIGGDATIIRFGDGEFTEAQRNLIGDYIAKHIVLPAIKNNSEKHSLNQLIILLPRAEAVFDDYQTKKKSGPCFEGTRVALLREMADWVTGQDKSRMYILSGLAGIGKSTVAYTVASRAANLNLLGASFFFSRDEADRNNAKKFFTTIAYQLCVYNEAFSKAIGEALLTERGSAAITKDAQEQLQVLILEPLRGIVQLRARPILIIVDALDECCEDDVHSVFTGLSQLVRDLPSFKVILTTRPQPYLDHFLRNLAGHKLFCLQDIEDKVIDDDIRLFLRHNLSLEKVQERFPKRKWCASDEQINFLVGTAGRLFIIASTSVRYILDKCASNPAAQMQELLRSCAENHAPFKDLGHFYTVILRNVIPEDCDNHNITSRYQLVVGAIILVQQPLHISVLGRLIGVDVEEIHAVLDNLQSVILLGEDNIPRIYHKSFPDYITDQARCKDPYLQFDPRVGHTKIAIRCFEIANQHLKYNILGLGIPARFMNNDDGLNKDRIAAQQVEQMIPEELRYACVYWTTHFEVVDIEDIDLMNGLAKFMDHHILHWFEVLSLIGKLDSAHHAIRVVLKFQRSISSDLHELLSDALRFISKFYEIVNRSAFQTYYSALPFAPTDSLLYRRYIKEARDGIYDIEGGPHKWNALVAELNHGEEIDVVKFSLNSALLVSYSEERVTFDFSNQGKLKIWDAVTGTPISTISGQRFAISNDFSTVASSEGKVITCYDQDGSKKDAIITTSSEIQNLALSSESNRVAAVLSCGDVCLWDDRNCELIDTFDKGHWNWLQFSSCGKRLAYASIAGIVKLRDGISGRYIADLQCGSLMSNPFQTDPSWMLTLSADGSRIAAVSPDSGLTLWNTASGGLICAVRSGTDGSDVVAISANGSLLATADGHNVTLWSENSDQLTKVDVLKLGRTGRMAFLLNNKLAISDYSGIKIYSIDIHTMSTPFPMQVAGKLAFSPDGTRLACGALLLDIRSTDASSSPSRNIRVTAITFSRDCSRLACGFEDGIVELWGTRPRMRQITCHQGHQWGMPISAIGFRPDGSLFASASVVGIIKLWNGGDGSLHGSLNAPDGLLAVALSNAVLVASGEKDVTWWDLGTLSPIHTFEISGALHVSISDESGLAAVTIFHYANSLILLDLESHTTISTFDIHPSVIQTLTFLPDRSHLVAQLDDGSFLSFNLINKHSASEYSLDHLIQLPNTPLWRGVPVWLCHANERYYVTALFSQHKNPLPILWIPNEIPVNVWAQGSSMIALGCGERRIILLRLPTDHVS